MSAKGHKWISTSIAVQSELSPNGDSRFVDAKLSARGTTLASSSVAI
jgi:hypothetical protein